MSLPGPLDLNRCVIEHSSVLECTTPNSYLLHIYGVNNMEGFTGDNVINSRSVVRMEKSILQHVLRDDNLRDLMLQHLRTTDLLAIARTCKKYRKLIMETRFDINAKLKRFNLDSVVGFRTELGRSGALISGSFALHFLLGTRTVWKDCDLDVLVEEGTRMARLEWFLVEKEGFALSETPQLGWSKCGVEVS